MMLRYCHPRQIILLVPTVAQYCKPFELMGPRKQFPFSREIIAGTKKNIRLSSSRRTGRAPSPEIFRANHSARIPRRKAPQKEPGPKKSHGQVILVPPVESRRSVFPFSRSKRSQPTAPFFPSFFLLSGFFNSTLLVLVLLNSLATKMASRMGPRTVKDATRFTSTIPHATSKAAGPSSGAANANTATPKPSRIPGETPEQRVRRLRLAHLAAQRAQISRTDRFIDASRRFLDVAHRWTVGGIVLFTGTCAARLAKEI